MPLAVESLTPDSDQVAIKQAISDSIAQCMQEGGRDQSQCAAIAFEQARKSTGKQLGSEV